MNKTSAGLLYAALLAAGSVALPAQGLVPNGDFERGSSGWSNIRFDDPAGSWGVGTADVSGTGASQALFADFRSPSRLAHADWLTAPFVLPDGTWPVSFAVMWQKDRPVQIPDPSGNWCEVHLLDPNGRIVFTGHIPVPRQANLLERRSFSGQVTVPVPGPYRAMISMRHSEQSGMGFVLWIDDLVVGDASWHLFGDGCPGTGGSVPMISARGAPTIGMRSWSVDLTRAFAPTTAWLGVGVSNTSWNGVPLPFDGGGGCMVRVGYLWTFGAQVQGTGPGTGRASYPIPLVPDPALRGATLYAQWLVVDGGSGSPFGVTTTAGLTAVIQ